MKFKLLHLKNLDNLLPIRTQMAADRQDEESGRQGDREMGGQGDGEKGRKGEREKGRKGVMTQQPIT